MKVFYADTVPLGLPEGHRFPAAKYPLLRQRVFASGWFSPEQLVEAQPATREQLLLVHTPEYVDKVLIGQLSEFEQRRIGLPWSAELVQRSCASVGGTIAACRQALNDGMGIYLGGGTHHAYPDHGEGFCVFNDVAVALRLMEAESRARHPVILDLDVHQGNGTAVIFANDPNVFTLSIHGEKNFPFHKESSDLDIPLVDGCGDEPFLEAVEWGVDRALQDSQSDLAVYIAGADPFQGDRLGRLGISKDGLARRDHLVFEKVRAAGLPVVVVMGGGYAKQIEDIVDIHLQTIRIALEWQSFKSSFTNH
jgi:acetoin utilization deacetylase AcuC-like enzyme